MKTKTERDTELKSLCGFKTYSGLAGYICIVGLIILLIGIVCPYCFYNPTTLDISKRTVHFWDLSFIYNSVTVICIIFAFGISEITKFLTNWRTRKNLLIISAVVVCILTIIAFIMQTIACVFYKIPEDKWVFLDIEFDVGYYLFSIGCCVFAIAYSIFVFLLIRVIDNKATIESLTFLNSKITKEKTQNTCNSTLLEKLEELKKLRENEMITEEEYQSKKSDLLEKIS